MSSNFKITNVGGEYPYEIITEDGTFLCKEVPVPEKDYSQFVSNNGKVAILYSPGYGAGWYSWNQQYGEKILKDTRIIKYRFAKILYWSDYPEYNDFMRYIGFENPPYSGGFTNIEICFIPQGKMFRINEYDGSESIEIFNTESYFTA